MYIQLNSQIICYEKTGEGAPVILLHGNGEDHHIFDGLVAELSKTNTVYAMDSRGHGESATPKELHYADMAEDVAGLIRALEIEKPVIIGYSDGGIVALLLAMKYSDKISKIICCGANLSPKGFRFGVIHDIKKEYKKTRDDKLLLMMVEPDIAPADLSKITVPAVIIAGEKDMIKESETQTIAKSIKNSKLMILPGEDHGSYITGAKLFNYIKGEI